MGARPKSGLIQAVLLGTLFVFYFITLKQFSPIASADPDRYFHLAMARMVAENGVIHSLPQVDNLEWKENYPDPYFLYHQINGLAYRLGGETLVLGLNALYACAFIALLFFILQTWTTKEIAFLLSFALLLTPFAANRLSLLRPHVPVLGFFLAIFYAAVKQRPVLLGASVLGFCSFYTAYYLPIALVGIILGAQWFAGEKPWRLVGGATIGLFLGIALHPTFPSNVEMAFLTATNAINVVRLESDLRPVEVKPMSWADFSSEHMFYLFAIVLSAALLRPLLSRRKNWEAISLLATAIFFWGLACLSFRAVEYALPFTMLLLAFALGRKERKWQKVSLGLAVAALIVPHTIVIFKFNRPMYSNEDRWKLVRSIPKDAKGKILNCEWDFGPFVLYQRPDMKFVDMSDPIALAKFDRERFQLREIFKRGLSPFPYGIARRVFEADYVLCEHPEAVDQMEKDPGFVRLFPGEDKPEKPIGTPHFFALKPKPPMNHTLDLEVAALPTRQVATTAASGFKGVAWQSLNMSQEQKESGNPFVDLMSWAKNNGADLSGGGFNLVCTAVRPTASAIKGAIGSTYLGLGGGQEYRVWLNGNLAHIEKKSLSGPRAIRNLLALKSPLRASDRIEIIVCGDPKMYMGLSLSFWNAASLKKACEGKAPGKDSSGSCLGPISAPQT